MVKAVYRSRASERSGPAYGASSRTLQTAEDIIPIAELKANMSDIVRGLDARPRPLVVTLNGKPAAVVMSPKEYDLLAYQSRFVEAVRDGRADVEAGLTFDGEQAIAEIMTEIQPRKPSRRRRAAGR
jgi:prevent-host-death family protein